jgi:hypothetical protein
MIVLAIMRLRKDPASKRFDIIFAIHTSKYRTSIIKMLNNVLSSSHSVLLRNIIHNLKECIILPTICMEKTQVK